MAKDQQKPDYLLIGVIFLIIIFGLVMLSSASSAIAFKERGDTYYFLKHQIFTGLLPGLFLFFIFIKINYRYWQKYTLGWFILSVVLLILPFIPGLGSTSGTSSHSWIIILGQSLQPAEIVKLTFTLFLAGWLATKQSREIQHLKAGFVPFLIFLGIIAGLILLQPDIGTLFIIASIAVAIFFAANGNLFHLFWLGLGGVTGLTVLIKLNPYQGKRLLTFLNPGLDPQGIGYHINQALLAIGSGGLLGRGLGQSRQKFQYLPEVFGDSIFAIIAEELGFIMVIVLIALFVFLMYRGLKLAEKTPDTYGRLIVIGIIFWFSFQALVNIASMVGLMPMTGLPLPFISYGGTSLMTSLAAVGILANVSKEAK